MLTRRLTPATWTLLLLLLTGLLLAGPGYGAAEPCWRGWVVSAEAVDGDTVDVDVSWEPRHVATERVRIVGIDTPELHGVSKAAGEAAKAYTAKWLADSGATELVVCRPARDSFGRLLGRLVSATKGDLGAALQAAGHAVPYPR